MLYLIAFTFALDMNARLVQPAEVLPPGERIVQVIKEDGWCLNVSTHTSAGRTAHPSLVPKIQTLANLLKLDT